MKVSNVQTSDDSLSFSVDKVGVPVLVKASYFPNWKVDGAKGPYRVAPNYMVVVPTSNRVTLTLRDTAGSSTWATLLPSSGSCCSSSCGGRARSGTSPSPRGPVVWRDGELRWHDEPELDLPPEPDPPDDPTADHDRFEVLADQVFGRSQGDRALAR